MILNTMKILNFAWILSIVLSIGSALAQDSDYDLERIKTLRGRIFHEITIVSSDVDGLMFRHKEGVAKVSFEELSINLREMFEPVPDSEDSFSTNVVFADEGKAVHEEALQPFAEEEEIIIPPQYVVEAKVPPPPVSTLAIDQKGYQIDIIVRNRLVLPAGYVLGYGACDPCARPIYWPSHWSRYHPAHRLSDPCFRELAVRDFLYTTGLLPRPPGVSVVRLPHSDPWRLH